MGVRAIKLPTDLLPIADMIVAAFQYPENPEWGIQADEQEDISREIKTIRKLWPLIRAAQVVSPPLRDIFRGFVWEEDGRIGGLVLTQRRGATSSWVVGVVGVLPQYRRKGIARKLLTRALAEIRECGGTQVILGVIEKNVPAYSLYKSLGFEHYSSQHEFHLLARSAPESVALPETIAEGTLGRAEWRPRFELAKRITPPEVVAYEPVEVGRFRPPIPTRILGPLMDRLRKLRQGRFVYRKDGELVGRLEYQTSGTGKGTSTVSARLDPTCTSLATYVLSKGMRAVLAVNPKLRIHFTAASWMPALVNAARDYGFELRVTYHMLGMRL